MSKFKTFFERAALPLIIILSLALGLVIGGGYIYHHSNQRYYALLGGIMGQE